MRTPSTIPLLSGSAELRLSHSWNLGDTLPKTPGWVSVQIPGPCMFPSTPTRQRDLQVQQQASPSLLLPRLNLSFLCPTRAGSKWEPCPVSTGSPRSLTAAAAHPACHPQSPCCPHMLSCCILSTARCFAERETEAQKGKISFYRGSSAGIQFVGHQPPNLALRCPSPQRMERNTPSSW